ncbi:hypothetical protein ACJMK2_026343 [Sinanodonta woodiana]|uniref:Ig-like domain-containing protein n=1 Tax=Sinanodonta woodiana TaxID=1069815 RepID=A0ABD3XJA5_SINWO
MKARLKITVLIFLVAVWFTEGLTWNTKMRSAVCCQGNNQVLLWNFTEGENERVTGLQWFFNGITLICLESNTTGFVVSNLYADRVERSGTAGILLKNVSLNDTGEYTLYVELEEETKRNVQEINLTVVEPPPSQCKPIIKKEHPMGILSCSTACGRSPLSVEWIINGTNDSGAVGPYFVVNSSGTSEQLICCLRDFKCLDDYQTNFCTQNNIPFTEDMHTVADTNYMVSTPISIFLIVAVVILIIVVVTLCVILNIRRCRLCCKYPYATTDAGHQGAETLLGGCKSVQINLDYQQVLTTDATTGQPLQDSNQQDQIANNSNRATDLVQSLVNKISTLEEQLKARDKEIKELRIQLRQERDLRKKEKGDSDFTNNDTDTFNISESEDASSELPSAPMLFHSESQGHSSGC